MVTKQVIELPPPRFGSVTVAAHTPSLGNDVVKLDPVPEAGVPPVADHV